MTAQTVYLIRSTGPLWDGIEATLARLPDVTLLDTTTAAAEARARAEELRPQLVVCGSTVEGTSALPLLAALRDALPETVMAVFGDGYTERELVELALLRVRGVIGWDGLAVESFPEAHSALRSGAFAVWDHALLETTFGALAESARRAPPPGHERSARISVLVIDPSDYSRAGLRALLSDDGRFVVVGDTARDGVSLAQRLRPTVILLDPDGGGRFDMDLVVALAAAVPESRICIRTSFFELQTILRALEAGSLAYFSKADGDSAFLHDALALVGRFGASITGPEVTGRFRAHQRERGLRLTVPQPSDTTLTDREREILVALAGGERDEGMATRFHVTKSTIESHVANLRVKLSAETRAHLIALAYERGLLHVGGEQA